MTELNKGVPTPELVEASVIYNVGRSANDEMKASYEALAAFKESLIGPRPDGTDVAVFSANDIIEMVQETMLTFLHVRDMMNMATTKQLQPIRDYEANVGHISIAEWTELSEAVHSDSRIQHLNVIVNEDVNAYSERTSKEMAEKLGNAFSEFLKNATSDKNEE